jgi:hypothetical protein
VSDVRSRWKKGDKQVGEMERSKNAVPRSNSHWNFGLIEDTKSNIRVIEQSIKC